MPLPNLAPSRHPVRSLSRSSLLDYFMILLLRPFLSGPPSAAPLLLLLLLVVVFVVARSDFSRHDGIFGSFAQIEPTVRGEE